MGQYAVLCGFFAFNLSPLKLECWDFLFYVCAMTWRGGVLKGQFCSKHCPPEAALRMMVGAGTYLRGIGALLGTSAPSSICVSQVHILRKPRLLFIMPGDLFQGHHGSLSPLFTKMPENYSPSGLGRGRFWLGQRAAMGTKPLSRWQGAWLSPSPFLLFCLSLF